MPDRRVRAPEGTVIRRWEIPDQYATCWKCGKTVEALGCDGPEVEYTCPNCEIFYIWDRRTGKPKRIQTFKAFLAGQARWETRREKKRQRGRRK